MQKEREREREGEGNRARLIEICHIIEMSKQYAAYYYMND